MFYRAYCKPFIDFLAALFLLIALSPLMVFIAIVNYCLYGTVLFVQERTGYHMTPFRFIKFKTMSDEVDKHGRLLPDMMRLNTFGKFLRNASLDELPQLWLVLIGTMSLIGPRPLLPEYNNFYNKEQKKRFDVKPGISGWAQVHGRNRQTWTERFAFDVFYVDNISCSLDIKIWFLTVYKVFKSNDINASENETMPPFNH